MRASFWELHRALAECYLQDTGKESPRDSIEVIRRRSQHDLESSMRDETSTPFSKQLLARRPSQMLLRKQQSTALMQHLDESDPPDTRSGPLDETPMMPFSQQVRTRRASVIKMASQTNVDEAVPGSLFRRPSLDRGRTSVDSPASIQRSEDEDDSDHVAKSENVRSGCEEVPFSSRVRARALVGSKREESPPGLLEEQPKRLKEPGSAPSLRELLALQGLSAPSDLSDVKGLKLVLRDCWNKELKIQAAGTLRSRKIGESRSSSKRSRGNKIPVPSWSEMPVQLDGLRRLLLHPTSGFKTFWNLAVAFLVLYDLMVIPTIAFSLGKNPVMQTMDVVMPIFWSIDFILTFFTGFYVEGRLVHDFRTIAANYAKSWMLYDLGLIILDWFFVAMDNMDTEIADWSRSLLMLRVLRLARIMRAIKLRRGFASLQDLLHSQAASLYLSFITNLGQLLIWNHWMACAWYGVRWWSSDQNWVIASGMDQRETVHQYLLCMLWAFCQLGVGESPFQPVNTVEMVLNCAVAFRSLITAATLISTMSDLIAGLRALQEDENRQFRLLRRFLSMNQIPYDLGQKVTQFVQHQYVRNKHARSSDIHVPLLDFLSGPLFRELQFSRHKDALCMIEVVDDLLEAPDLQILEALHSVSSSLHQLVAATGDIVFLSGNIAETLYFKQTGSLAYHNDEGTNEVPSSLWVSEVCLWTPWAYMGDLEACEVAEVLSLDAGGFCTSLGRSYGTQRVAVMHARKFVEAMSEARIWSDLFVLPREDDDNNGDVPLIDLPIAPMFGRCCPGRKRRRGSLKIKPVIPDDDTPDLY